MYKYTVNIIIFFIIVLFSTPSVLLGYTIKNKTQIEKYKEAYRLFRKKKFKLSYKIINDLIDQNDKFLEAKLLLAKLYQKLSSIEDVVNILDDINSNKIKDVYLLYDVAYLYYRCGKYKSTKKILKQFKQKSLPKSLKKKFRILSKNINFSIKAKSNKYKFNPRPLPRPLNKFAAQYFPVLSIDSETIYFTGRTTYDIKAIENIYISKKLNNKKWSKPVFLSENINTNNNEGACTISADGNLLIFSAYHRKENIGSCDLYYSEKKGKNWSVPKNLGSNINSPGWQSQPSLSSDGKYLYFASKREGNIGVKDIWYSKKNDKGRWQPAVNLGPIINSKGIEISPFIHPNGSTLFFASDRSPSLGGLDLYYSQKKNGVWSKPKNLGYPINDHLDQVSLFISADGRKGWYAAGSQKGVHYNGKLYEFDMPNDTKINPRCTFLKGNIIVESGESKKAFIKVVNKKTNKIEMKINVGENGNYCIPLKENIDYKIKVSKKNFLPKILTINLIEKTDLKPIFYDCHLKKIKKDIKVLFENIVFEFDKYDIKESGIKEVKALAEFLIDHPNYKVIIEGYTDSDGPKSYNKKLSYLRAKSVYLELLKHKVSEKRISFIGLGIADDQDDKKLNRKVSFRLVDNFEKTQK